MKLSLCKIFTSLFHFEIKYLLDIYATFFQNGMNAVSMRIAEQYVAAFSNLAKKGNTVLLPSSAGDVSSMVSQVNNFNFIFAMFSLYHVTTVFS